MIFPEDTDHPDLKEITEWYIKNLGIADLKTQEELYLAAMNLEYDRASNILDELMTNIQCDSFKNKIDYLKNRIRNYCDFRKE